MGAAVGGGGGATMGGVFWLHGAPMTKQLMCRGVDCAGTEW